MGIPKHEVICGIYKITSPTGKIYIGQSIDILEAWRMRYFNKRKTQSQKKLYATLNKHGRKNHVFEIIHVCIVEELDKLEIYYINKFDTFNTPHGLNLSQGGGGIRGFKHTEETKKRISEKTKGNKNCLGQKQSPEHLANRIKGMTGKKRSPEFSQRLREVNLGKKHSEETRAKIRISVNQPEYKKRMLSYRLGIPKSPESIEKTASKLRKLILNTQTGIFYFGLREAAASVGLTHKYLGQQLCGVYKNYTSLIYV